MDQCYRSEMLQREIIGAVDINIYLRGIQRSTFYTTWFKTLFFFIFIRVSLMWLLSQ